MSLLTWLPASGTGDPPRYAELLVTEVTVDPLFDAAITLAQYGLEVVDLGEDERGRPVVLARRGRRRWRT